MHLEDDATAPLPEPLKRNPLAAKWRTHRRRHGAERKMTSLSMSTDRTHRPPESSGTVQAENALVSATTTVSFPPPSVARTRFLYAQRLYNLRRQSCGTSNDLPCPVWTSRATTWNGPRYVLASGPVQLVGGSADHDGEALHQRDVVVQDREPDMAWW
jgi:hypothetical protein